MNSFKGKRPKVKSQETMTDFTFPGDRSIYLSSSWLTVATVMVDEEVLCVRVIPHVITQLGPSLGGSHTCSHHSYCLKCGRDEILGRTSQLKCLDVHKDYKDLPKATKISLKKKETSRISLN